MTGAYGINAPAAWDSQTDCSAVYVGVIDEGIDYNHPDLAANIWTNAAEAAGTPGVDNDGNGALPAAAAVVAALLLLRLGAWAARAGLRLRLPCRRRLTSGPALLRPPPALQATWMTCTAMVRRLCGVAWPLQRMLAGRAPQSCMLRCRPAPGAAGCHLAHHPPALLTLPSSLPPPASRLLQQQG